MFVHEHVDLSVGFCSKYTYLCTCPLQPSCCFDTSLSTRLHILPLRKKPILNQKAYWAPKSPVTSTEKMWLKRCAITKVKGGSGTSGVPSGNSTSSSSCGNTAAGVVFFFGAMSAAEAVSSSHSLPA